MNEYQKILLVSPDFVKSTSLINYNLDDKVVAETISNSQNVYMRNILGDDLIDWIQYLVYNKLHNPAPDPSTMDPSVILPPTIDDENQVQYKELLNQYIKPYLKYKAQSEILFNISFKIRNTGVVRNGDTNITPTSPDELNRLRNQMETLVCDAANRMVDFLSMHREAYPELNAQPSGCGCGGKKLPNLCKRYANTPLFLNINR